MSAISAKHRTSARPPRCPRCWPTRPARRAPDAAMRSSCCCAGKSNEEHWISPDTRASRLAPYLAEWKRKVERVGTLNFPSAARRQGLSGSPVVEVEIAADGRLAVGSCAAHQRIRGARPGGAYDSEARQSLQSVPAGSLGRYSRGCALPTNGTSSPETCRAPRPARTMPTTAPSRPPAHPLWRLPQRPLRRPRRGPPTDAASGITWRRRCKRTPTHLNSNTPIASRPRPFRV